MRQMWRSVTLPPLDAVNDIGRVRAVGEEQYLEFKKIRIQNDQHDNTFFHTLSKQKLKTFSNVAKTMSVTKEIVLKADGNLFGHTILIVKRRHAHAWWLTHSDLFRGHLQMVVDLYGRQTRLHYVESLKNLYRQQKLFTCHQLASLMDWVLCKKMNDNGKTVGQLADSILSVILN